ncbi:MAG TPA: N-acetyl-gamma-glutamyl-phosphate reductase [Steroidobacteraceae bacterium]|jgi:N-acetyl-gamma-glutamyl-phosphate reductase|nr:N-acetyl-gamma-glutamyl-phosphate reductase [Steroidobacteraceae bacterium]
MSARTPAVVLGGSGYVAGELLRLIAAHPQLELLAAVSDSQPGEPLAGAFPHLAPSYPGTRFCTLAEAQRLVREARTAAVFSAAPHGVSARLIDALLSDAEAAGAAPRVVDLSADFRYSTLDAYAAVYPHPHGAPQRLKDFTCALPEHLAVLPTPHVAHPGCFATAALIACMPLIALGLAEPRLYVSGVTGSTGSGRKPVEGTHHPLRHGDLYSYSALAHRHAPEVVAGVRAATGVAAEVAFVPHSGPFARGIHVTVQAALRRPLTAAELIGALREYYARAPFVRVSERAPRVKEVAASNYAQLSAVTDGGSVAVLCALDNLAKGAAGGAVQWMNRMLGLAETAGLTASAPGWT